MALLQLRIDDGDKTVLEIAAALQGTTLSDFVRVSALKAARAMRPTEVDAIRAVIRQQPFPSLESDKLGEMHLESEKIRQELRNMRLTWLRGHQVCDAPERAEHDDVRTPNEAS